MAMQIVCQGLSKQVMSAATEGDQNVNITGYSDDLIQCLGKEKGSIMELINHMNELLAGFKECIERGKKEWKGLGMMEDTSEKEEGGGETEEAGKQNEEKSGEAEAEEGEEFMDGKDT